jgi:hypothetical protein
MVVGVAEGEQPLVVNAADGSQVRVAAAPGGPVEFRLTRSASQGVEIAVTKGNLKVTTADGERILAAGEATEVVHRHAGDTMKLLGFPKSLSPGIDARFQFAANMQIPLTWGTVPGAMRYYVQLARDTEFHDLVLTAETTAPNTSFTADRAGMYAWRVAARDASGRLGEFGFARRIYCENDQPRDLLIAPSDGFKVSFPKAPPPVDFSWRPLGEAKKYKLVVERGAPGSDPIVTTTTSAQHVSVSLQEGTYAWGVYAVSDDREDPIFLSMRRLTISKQQGPKIKTEVLWNQPAH